MLKIMIVEDDVMFRYAFREMLNNLTSGMRVEDEAINGKEALSILSQRQPDIIITDISMPEMNGIDLIRNVSEQYPAIKIIVLSSHDDFKFVKDALMLGAQDYLLKHDLDEESFIRTLKKVEALIYGEQIAPSVQREYRLEVSQAIEHIRLNYMHELRLSALADEVSVSPNYLCNIFKNDTGLTIFEYIKNVRIDEAKELLKNTNLRLYEVADRVGFTNASYFCNVFKEVTGKTVKSFRQSLHNSNIL